MRIGAWRSAWPCGLMPVRALQPFRILGNFVQPTLPVSFGKDTKYRRSKTPVLAQDWAVWSIGFNLLLRFALVTMFNVNTIIRKRDHQKFLNFFPAVAIISCDIDMLVEFCQNHIYLTLLKRLDAPYPSIFTNFCTNYYAHVPCGEKKWDYMGDIIAHLRVVNKISTISPRYLSLINICHRKCTTKHRRTNYV